MWEEQATIKQNIYEQYDDLDGLRNAELIEYQENIDDLSQQIQMSQSNSEEFQESKAANARLFILKSQQQKLKEEHTKSIDFIKNLCKYIDCEYVDDNLEEVARKCQLRLDEKFATTDSNSYEKLIVIYAKIIKLIIRFCQWSLIKFGCYDAEFW